MTNEESKKNIVYLNLPAAFVKEGLTNSQTGEQFNVATLPAGTMVNGKDVGNYQFSPLFVQKPNLFDEHNKVIRDSEGKPVADEKSKKRVLPMLADNEIWLRKRGVDGYVKVQPVELKAALVEGRKNYIQQQQEKRQAKAQTSQKPKNVGNPFAGHTMMTPSEANKKAEAHNKGLSKDKPAQTHNQSLS